jgi:RHS repeat-associated protein
VPSVENIDYTYNADNRLLTGGTTTFNYDNNGNLVTKTVEGNASAYTWDYNNMLTQLVGGGNTFSYKYDGVGNRIAKTVNSVETRYVIDPSGALANVLAETNATGSITAYYVYGLGLIAKITPVGQALLYHYDGIGSTIATTDSSGNAVNKYAYDAFGKVLEQEEVEVNPFTYVGRFGVMDEGNGLLYMRARYYDPETGRFINKDPIGLVGGINMYAYVTNNPINFVDPLGLVGASGCCCDEDFEEEGLQPPPWYLDPIVWIEIIVGGWGKGPWIGTIGMHPPHHGLGKHLELILRGGIKIFIPGKGRPIGWIFPK